MMFYKETNFKDTEIGRIPKEWEVVKLGDGKIAEIRGNRTINNIQKVAFIPMELVPDHEIFAKYEIRDLKDISSSTYCEAGDLLLAKITPSLENGKQGIVPEDIPNGFALATTEVYPIVCKGINRLFLFYVLKFPKFRKILEFSMRGTTGRQRVPKDAVEKLKIPLPPDQEQQKIAEILSAVDEAIQKTNEIIAKTERLKKGLMQELLTKGIGHKEFKDTEIGRIPEDWEVVKLGNKELATIIMGQSPPSSTYNREGRGLPFLQGKMEFGDVYPSPVLYCSQPIKIAEPDDILISVRAPVGDVNIAPYRLCIGRGLAAIRFNLNRANHWFYFYYFQKIKNFLENLGKGSTFKAITKEDLESLKVPYPLLSEQQKIAEILSTVDKKLEIERKEKARLEKIKQGLMDLLLTGKVRVKVN
jgi:type I restriction enzyme S subunit